MSDPIPPNIVQRITGWLSLKRPCQIQLNVSPAGRIVDAEMILKERVKAE